MLSGKENNRWARLDNASNIFPSTTNRRDTKVFRLTCELHDDINPTLLQRALDKSLLTFPHYRASLRRGFFWYYLDLQEQSIPVVEEKQSVCAPLFTTDGGQPLIRVVYYRRRFSVEIFHALTDGVGGMLFFRLLIFNYLLLVKPSYKELNLPSPVSGSLKEKLADSYHRLSSFIKSEGPRAAEASGSTAAGGPTGAAAAARASATDLPANFPAEEAATPQVTVEPAEGRTEATAEQEPIAEAATPQEQLPPEAYYTRRLSEEGPDNRTVHTPWGDYRLADWMGRTRLAHLEQKRDKKQVAAGTEAEEGADEFAAVAEPPVADSPVSSSPTRSLPTSSSPDVVGPETGLPATGKPWPAKAYRIRGERSPAGSLTVVEGVFSMRSLKDHARQYDVSVTVFLTALLIYSVGLDMRAEGSRFPIVVTVPVDLRRRFPSYTTRNFFTTVDISYQWRSVPIFESLLEAVKAQFEQALQPDFLRDRLARQLKYENKLYTRLVPTPLKDWVLRLVHRLTDRGLTTGLSNLGRLELPGPMEEAVYQVGACTSVRRPQFCAMSIGDRMTITFTSPFVDTEIQRHFFTYLARAGIDVTIASNLNRRPDKSALHTMSASLATELVTLSPELAPRSGEGLETNLEVQSTPGAGESSESPSSNRRPGDKAESEVPEPGRPEQEAGAAVEAAQAPTEPAADRTLPGADFLAEEEISAVRLVETEESQEADKHLPPDLRKGVEAEGETEENLDTDDLSDLSDLGG